MKRGIYHARKPFMLVISGSNLINIICDDMADIYWTEK
tara:strand:+ start:1420 stop:1533 length:114 start_codon:yes stop_codon:yes gene_type:complete